MKELELREIVRNEIIKLEELNTRTYSAVSDTAVALRSFAYIIEVEGRKVLKAMKTTQRLVNSSDVEPEYKGANKFIAKLISDFDRFLGNAKDVQHFLDWTKILQKRGTKK